jgi:hypothetical protein
VTNSSSLLLLSVVMLTFSAQRVAATSEQPRDMQYHQQQHQQHQQHQPHVQLTHRSLITDVAAAVPAAAAAAAAVANTTSEEDIDTRGWPVYGNW